MSVHQTREDLFAGAAVDDPALGDRRTERLQHLLEEDALELGACASERGVAPGGRGVRGDGGRVHPRPRRSGVRRAVPRQRPVSSSEGGGRRTHRIVISAFSAPTLRSDSKIAAIAAGGAATACSALATSWTVVPGATRISPAGPANGSPAGSVAPIASVIAPWLTTASPTVTVPPETTVPSRLSITILERWSTSTESPPIRFRSVARFASSGRRSAIAPGSSTVAVPSPSSRLTASAIRIAVPRSGSRSTSRDAAAKLGRGASTSITPPSGIRAAAPTVATPRYGPVPASLRRSGPCAVATGSPPTSATSGVIQSTPP